MPLKGLSELSKNLNHSPSMPIMFVGHGSPMNGIEENEFTQGFQKAVSGIPTPQAILCISAHWETSGTYVTGMQHPRTIHDFGGFPQALFDVEYPAPGAPELAREIKGGVQYTNVELDNSWGLDHGTWTVLKNMYPKADIPVLQMSLNYNQSLQYHYQLAKELSFLRNKGVLIIGSGNMIHNLGKVEWSKINEPFAFDWNTEALSEMKSCIKSGDHQSMLDFRSKGKSWDLAIPTPEHYLPLLYILALQGKAEEAQFFNEKPVAGSIDMSSVIFG